MTLREIRERLGYSRSRLAKQANIDYSVLYKLEKGHVYPYPNWVKRIAAALGVSEDELRENCGWK